MVSKTKWLLLLVQLFHGQMHEQTEKSAKKSFDTELDKLIESKLPGCIVISDRPSPATCIVYVFGGEIVGIYSRKEGWLKPKIELVRKIHKCLQKATGSILFYTLS